MKISLISTVYNEASNIEEFLVSIASMTKRPDEVILVDGGSSDGTYEFLQEYAASAPPFGVSVLREQGCNIARGRNIAIAAATHDIIAVSDAGCRLDCRWLEEITRPLLDSRADVAGGWYEPDARTGFEKAASLCTFTRLSRVDGESFLPSSRSIAFTRKSWASAGGYPEWLTLTAEDTLFDLSLKENGCRFAFVPTAVVCWRPRRNLPALMKQYRLYGFGDGEARIVTSYGKISLTVLWTLLVVPASFLVLDSRAGLLAIATAAIAYGRNLYRLDWKYLAPALVLAFLSDAARLSGWVQGFRREKTAQQQVSL